MMGHSRFWATVFLLALAAVRLPVDPVGNSSFGIGPDAIFAADTSGRQASVPRIIIEPRPVIDLGLVRVGTRRDTVVRIILLDTTSLPYSVRLGPSSSNVFSLGPRTGSDAGVLVEGRPRIDTIVYMPTSRGPHTAHLIVTSLGNTSVYESIQLIGIGGMTIVAFDTGTGGKTGSVKTLDFGAIPANSGRTFPVTIHNIGDFPVAGGLRIDQQGAGVFRFDVISGSTSGPFEPGDSIAGTVTFDPKGATGTFSGDLYFPGDTSAAALRLVARSAPVRRLGFAPDTLRFEPSDTCRLSSFRVWNSGTETLRIDSIIPTKGPFRIVGQIRGRPILPGDTLDVTVSYCPVDMATVHTGSAGIYSNADNGSMQRIFFVATRSTISWQIDSTSPPGLPLPLIEIPDTATDSVVFHLRSLSSAPMTFAASSLVDGGRGFELVPNTEIIKPGEKTRLVVRFRPAGRIGLVNETLRLVGRGDAKLIPLSGRGVAGRLDYAPPQDTIVRLPATVIAESTTAAIFIRNTGNLPVVIERNGLVVTGSAGAFAASLASGVTGALTIPPEKTDSVLVTYAPTVPGLDSAELRIVGTEIWKGFPLRDVRIRFHLRGEAVVKRTLVQGGGRLVAKPVAIGDTIDLPFTVQMPLTQLDGVEEVNVRFALRAGALYPIDARSPAGPLRIARDTGGQFTVEGKTPTPIVGSELFTLRVMPLSAARSVETITVLSARLGQTGLGNADLDTANAAAHLDILGCGVGASPFGRRALIAGVSIRPGGTEAVVEYTAPAGGSPIVRVVDFAGRERLRKALPDGADEPRSAHIRLDQLPPGIYLLELRTAGDRSAVPIFLVR